MNALSRLLRLPLRLVPAGLTVPILSGTLMGWKWITGASTHGCWLGTYEREAQRVFRQCIGQGDVVHDIGANVGFFTLLAAKLSGRGGAVYAFEPVPRNLDYLRRHVAANAAAAASVRVLPIALSSASGTARFSAGANPSMGKLDAAGDVEVAVETIDDLVRSERILPPRFMKIDVEGAELDVLAGATMVLQRHRPAILLSCHGYRLHEQCTAVLRGLGYGVETVRDGRVDGQYTVLARA